MRPSTKKMKKGIEQLANSMKNINNSLRMLTQQSKSPLQGNGMAAISKTHVPLFG